MANEIEQLLILDWQQTRNEELFEDALELCRPILLTVGKKYFGILDPDEIKSACNLGFYQAAESYKPDMGMKFGTFLWMICKRKLITEIIRLNRQRDKNAEGVTVKPVSLDAPVELDGEEFNLAEIISDPNQPTPADTVEEQDAIDTTLAQVEERLTPLETAVLHGRLAGDSYKEIAKKTGRSKKAVDNATQRQKIKSTGQLREAFFNKVEKREDGCWEWRGTRRPLGVCQLSFGGELLTAMRVSWQLAGNPPPPRKGLVRTCSTEYCVNPRHHRIRDCFLAT